MFPQPAHHETGLAKIILTRFVLFAFVTTLIGESHPNPRTRCTRCTGADRVVGRPYDPGTAGGGEPIG